MATVTRGSRAAALSALLALLLAGASGAPRAVRIRVGDTDPACPWRVALVGNERVEHCVNEVVLTFSGPPSPGGAVPKDVESDPVGSEQGAPGAPAGYAPLAGADADGDGNWYKLHRRGRAWLAAKAECEAEGAHLVVLNSREEAEGVRALIDRHEALRGLLSHVGVHPDIVTERGESFASVWHERWIRGEEYARACGQMDADGFLLMDKCRDEEPFVCEFETPSAPTAPPPPPASLASPSNVDEEYLQRMSSYYTEAPGWNSSVYLLTNGPLMTDCAGGSLAVFETEEEMAAVIDFLQEKDFFGKQARVGYRSGGPITILGGAVNATGYNWWSTKNEENMCFMTDLKLLLHSSRCYFSETLLCELNKT